MSIVRCSILVVLLLSLIIFLVSCASINKQLLSAIEAGNTDAALALLENKNAPRSGEKEVIPLIKAAAVGNVDIVKALISSGVDLNVRGYAEDASRLFAVMSTEGGGVNWAGAKTALMTAIDAGHPDIAEILVEAGADVNLAQYDDPMADGFTPIFSAIRADNRDIVKLLITNGADTKVVARYISTAGGFIISEGGFARPSTRQLTPITPREYAELLGRTDIVTMLSD